MNNATIKTNAALFVLFILLSWPTHGQNGALVSISAKSKGALQTGYGIEITMTNIKTKQSCVSESLGPISPHSVIQNLPAGSYLITQIKVPLGDLMYTNSSEVVKEFFGILEIEEEKNYYLGYFSGTRKVGKKDVFILRIDDESIPQELLKKLLNKGIDLNIEDFIKTYPYDTDELMMY